MENRQLAEAQAEIDAEMVRFDRETHIETELRADYQLELSQYIEQKNWEAVAETCEEAGLNFEEWAMDKMRQDSLFAESLIEALFYRYSIEAVECAANIVDSINFDDMINERIESENEQMQEDEELRGIE